MKSVVVLSGGMDSATALAQRVKEVGSENVFSIGFNYGSKHNARENFAAKRLAAYYQIRHKHVTMPFISKLFRSSLLQLGEPVPEGHYEDSNMIKTVVPFRNAILLSVAAGYAESIDAKTVIIGSHAGDHAIYPDCREDFMKSFSEAVYRGTWSGIMIRRPFEKLSKGEIVQTGTLLDVPYEMTYSCYNGREKHCGRCGTCVERLLAFKEAGGTDPLDYEDRDFAFNVKPAEKTNAELVEGIPF